jgi:hypothetical protein
MLAQAICAFPHSRPDISYEEQALVLLLVPGSGWASQQREDEDLQRGVGEKQPAGRKMKDERTVVRRKMIIGHERLPLPNWTAYGVRRHSARFASCELLLHGSRFEVVQRVQPIKSAHSICTTGPARRVTRWEQGHLLEAMQKRLTQGGPHSLTKTL